MKEEYDAKVQAAIKSEGVYKNKLLLLEERFASTEAQLEKTETKFKECVSKLRNVEQVTFTHTIWYLCGVSLIKRLTSAQFTDNRKVDRRERQCERNGAARDRDGEKGARRQDRLALSRNNPD